MVHNLHYLQIARSVSSFARNLPYRIHVRDDFHFPDGCLPCGRDGNLFGSDGGGVDDPPGQFRYYLRNFVFAYNVFRFALIVVFSLGLTSRLNSYEYAKL